jgi:hypothetical protein
MLVRHRPMCPLRKVSRLSRPLDNASFGRHVPRTIRSLDDASMTDVSQPFGTHQVRKDFNEVAWHGIHYNNILCQFNLGRVKYLHAIQGRDTSVRDTMSKECIVHGTEHPRLSVWEHIGRGHFITSCATSC